METTRQQPQQPHSHVSGFADVLVAKLTTMQTEFGGGATETVTDISPEIGGIWFTVPRLGVRRFVPTARIMKLDVVESVFCDADESLF